MSFFHKHEFNELNGVLWCKCGEMKTLCCVHKWEKTNEYKMGNIFNNNPHTILQELTCSKCGDKKVFKIGIGDV